MSTPHSSYDDDIDDIMASIMRGEQRSQNIPAKKPRRQRKPDNRPLQQPAAQAAPQTKVKQPKPQKVKAPRKPLPTRAIKRVSLTLIVLAVLITGGIFLKDPLLSLLRPKPPFSQEIVENMGVPLYYPTKLPGTYKLETDSISQPENNSTVVVYAISDDDGKKINITQQQQPSDITLDPLYAVLDKVREIDTKFGSIKIGVNEGTTNIANILTGKTWIIVNYSVDTIQDAGLAQIINSLEF